MSGTKTESKQKKSRPILCVVTSASMAKSRVGTFERLVKHPQYKKFVKKRTKLMFHDDKDETRVGDSVLIIPARPRSARKRFDLLKVVKRGEQAE